MALKRKYFSEDEIAEIKKMGLHKHLDTAYHFQYKMGSPKGLNDKLADMYEVLDDATPFNRNWSCGNCAYEAFRIMGERYFKSIEYHERKNKSNKSADKSGDNADKSAESEKSETVITDVAGCEVGDKSGTEGSQG